MAENLGSLGSKGKRKLQTRFPSDDGWGEYGGYMEAKRKKLHEQYVAMGSNETSIFNGVSIYIDGYTDPREDELKRLMRAHGGNYEYAFYPSKVTHVIATALANAKAKHMKNVEVVHPKWILDSIEAGRKLPTAPYQILRKTPNNQKQLSCMKQEEGGGDPKDLANLLMKDEITDMKQPSSKVSSESHFVAEFYNHSRLHHLSTWSSQLQDFVTETSRNKIPSLKKLSSSLSLRGQYQNAYVHIDMDCFFVSVSRLGRPDLIGQPIAVTHAKGSKDDASTMSYSDIASCSYEARGAGIRNGMLLGKAMKLCPNLVTVPYNFEKYLEVSKMFYTCLLEYTHQVEVVSCDEAFIDLSDLVQSFEEASEVMRQIRKRIEETSGCCASCGIGPSFVVARMATRAAKPNGQRTVHGQEVEDFMASQSLSKLPGVGYATSEKLNERGLLTCADLRTVSLADLQEWLGVKTAQTLHDYCLGKDNRSLKISKDRKSISVEMNYGMRFSGILEAESMISALCCELEKRALEAKKLGSTITLKLKMREENAPINPSKYLGHGLCVNVARSATLPKPTNESDTISNVCHKLLHQLKLVPQDIRGIGIHVSKLKSSDQLLSGPMSKFLVRTNPFQDQEKDTKEMTEQFPIAPAPSSLSKSSSSLLPVPPEDDSALSHSFFEGLLVPPSSELDQSVLNSLPTTMKDRIIALSSAAGSSSSENSTPIHKISRPATTGDGTCQFTFTELKEYFCNWLNSSPTGPLEEDLSAFSNYMCEIAHENLEFTFATMKMMRRKLQVLVNPVWRESFNLLLEQVNKEIFKQTKGNFDIHKL